VNGSEVSRNTTAGSTFLDSSFTLKGWNVTVEITPSDSYSNGTAVNSTLLTVSNSLPSFKNVFLNNSNVYNYTTGSLTCWNGSVTEPDINDWTGLKILWFVNDVINSSFENSSVITSDNLTVGEVYVCEMSAYNNGTVYGAGTNSSSLTIVGVPSQATTTSGSSSSGGAGCQLGFYKNEYGECILMEEAEMEQAVIAESDKISFWKYTFSYTQLSYALFGALLVAIPFFFTKTYLVFRKKAVKAAKGFKGS